MHLNNILKFHGNLLNFNKVTAYKIEKKDKKKREKC